MTEFEIVTGRWSFKITRDGKRVKQSVGGHKLLRDEILNEDSQGLYGDHLGWYIHERVQQ